MKYLASLILLLCTISLFGQKNPKKSTIQFVEILDGNRAEAIYYFQNNWKVLREKALAKGHIADFHLMETKKSENAPFDLILMTTYPTEEKYANREVIFEKLISERGGLKLLNEKKPSEFRNSISVNEEVTHLE